MLTVSFIQSVIQKSSRSGKDSKKVSSVDCKLTEIYPWLDIVYVYDFINIKLYFSD